MMPRIYIRDQNDEVLDTLDEGQYFDDNMQRFLKGKATVLSFTIVKTEDSYALMTAGRNLSFRYDEEDFWLSCVIVEQDETYLTVTAWSLGLELNNETHGPYKAPKAMTFAEYLAVIDIERILTIGINEVSDKKISHEWEGTESKLARLYSLATVFSAELAFDTELNEDGSLKQISLNVYREHSDADQGLGQDRRNETFYFGEDIKTIRKTEDTSDLYTAIFATGKDGLTIAGIEKEVFDEDGNLLFATYKTQKPGFGDPRKLYAPQARDQFPSNTTGGDRWTLNTAGEFEYESAEALLGYMMSELKKNCQPATTWEIEGYIKAKIGDTVRIADEGYKPTLYLEARVIEQEISFSDKTKNKSTFSNVVELESQVDSSLLDRVQKLIEANKTYQYSISTDNGIVFKNNTGVTTLTATVRDGVADVTANFGITWFKDGVSVGSGVSLTVRATDVAEKAVYRFEASKSDGTVAGGYEVTVTDVNDGKGGEPGRGIDGTPETTYAKSANGTTPPTTGWTATRPDVPAGQFLWTKTTTKYTDDTESTTLIPTLMGPKGDPGAAGVGLKDKAVEYAKGTSGTVPPTTGWSETIPTVGANEYLWTRTTLEYTDDSSTVAYSIGKIGANGSDAQLLYLTATAENMVFDADDTPKTAQTITISAKLQNVTGTATFKAIPYIGNTAQSAITLGESGNNRTLTSSQWTNKDWTLIAITATLGSLSDTLSVVKVKDGSPGDDGVSSYLHVRWKMADGKFSTVYPSLNLMATDLASPYHAGSTISWAKVANGEITYSRNAATNGGVYVDDGTVLEAMSDYVVHFKIAETSAVKVITDCLVYTPFTGLLNEKAYLDGTMMKNTGVGKSTPVAFDLTDGLEHDVVLTFSTPAEGEWSKASYQGHILQLLKTTAIAYSVSIKQLKFEKSGSPTIYTPTPAEDYSLAYPKYRGEYTDTVEAGSADPNRYTWTAYLGEQGPPTGVISQNTVPTSPYVGMLWQCTGNIAGYINPATYRWNGSAWTIYQFTAQNILAETFTGFVFQGVQFIGSEFISQYEVTSAGGIKTSGELTIGDGLMLNQYQTGSDTSGMFKVDRDGDISNSRNEAGVSSQYELTADHLSMFSNGIGGQLTARQLMQVPWTNLPYESGFTTAENNPCQYRVVYLLDGSRELQMRGQVQNTAGTALPTATSPYIGLLPATARPIRNELVAAADSSRKGARVAVLKNGYIQIDTPNANTTYVSLGGIRILLD